MFVHSWKTGDTQCFDQQPESQNAENNFWSRYYYRLRRLQINCIPVFSFYRILIIPITVGYEYLCNNSFGIWQ